MEPDGNIHALARGLKCPSAIAIGHGPDGFREGNLYAVTFHGDIVELTPAVNFARGRGEHAVGGEAVDRGVEDHVLR